MIQFIFPNIVGRIGLNKMTVVNAPGGVVNGLLV